MRKAITHQYYSRAGSFAGIDKLAAELGKPIEPMMQRFGFSMALLDEPEARISYNGFCALIEACGEEWNCPDFGLRLGARQDLNMFGPVGLVTRLTDTVGDALRALEGQIAIHSSGFSTYIEPGDSTKSQPAAIVFTPKPGAGAGRHNVELSLCVAYNVLALISGISRLRPVRVEFQHASPVDPMSAKRFFGCPVHYGEPANALFFDPVLLRRPTAVLDRAVAPLVKSYLERARRLTETDIVEVTRELMGQLLSTGRCSREVVAELLHLTPKTLQRRLDAKGETFAGLLDNYRRSKAMELVTQRSMPLLQIALALGYADQSSFNQAFRRWTDTTPTDFLKNATGS